jgi:hypothetical protein
MQRNHIHLFEGETSMTAEDEEFNRMEREADLRRKAVSAALNEHVMHMRAHLSEYERGVIDGRQMQVQSSVDKAVNAMSKREWVGLTPHERMMCRSYDIDTAIDKTEAKLKEKNGM